MRLKVIYFYITLSRIDRPIILKLTTNVEEAHLPQTANNPSGPPHPLSLRKTMQQAARRNSNLQIRFLVSDLPAEVYRKGKNEVSILFA